MANDMQRSFRLFVTHVDGDGPFLKICGQLEKQSACMVESLIESSRENFEKGIGAVPAVAIREGIVCAAKYKDGTYYRAKIISVAGLASGLVGVHFIDYGNKDVISLSTIRFLDNYDPILLKLPGQGSDYYLSRIMHPTGRWEEQLLLKLQSLLCYSEYPATIEAQTHTVPIIAVLFQGNDLSQHLVANKYGIALPVTKQEVLLLQLMNESVQAVSPSWPQSFSPDVNSYADHVPFLVHQNFPSNPASAMRLQQNVSIGYNSGYATPPSAVSQRLLVTKATRTPVNLRAPMRQPGTPSPIPVTTPPAHMQTPTTPPSKLGSPKRATKTYKSKLLEASSQHKVFVSYAEEGPELFAVQLVTDAKKLEIMMDEINRQPHRSLAEPPMIGTVCLGRMSGDRIICRAIVMNLSGQQCKLFFVDFGDTEMVSYYDIFDIPEEFVKPNVFAMRFCLSGVKNLQKGPYLNEAFKQLVNGKVLTLRVVPPEGPPLIQYGELFLETQNVLDMLQMTIKETLQFKWIEPLVRGSRHSVLVSYVDSCVKFFVQRSDQIDELNAVMAAVKTHCERSTSPGQLPVGAACCARFADDDNWYRARVREVRGNKSVVAYVDYGNEQEVVAADLRTISPELIQLPAQALKCSLKGFEDKPVETKTSNQLEMLALEKTLMAHIMGVVSEDTMLVSLVDDTVSPPLDVARKMLQLSQPRSNHEPKATTPVRKDAPEAFSSPEGSQPDDKRKPFRREASFKEERRNTSREGDDFAQRGGSFRGRENKDGFDRSGPGRHSEKFGGRPDKEDRRGGKPWENKSPVSAADDQWEEPPPAAQRPSRDNRDKDNKFNKQDEWEEKKTDTWDSNRPRPERRDFGDRQDRPERRGFGDREDRPERRGFGDRDNRPERRDFGDRENRPERRDFGDRDNRPERRDFGDRDNRPERRDFGDRDSRPERKDFGDRNGDRRNNWEDRKENNFQKRDFRGGDRPPRTNFNPRDRADRSFGSDGNKSDKSNNSARPYKPRGKFSEVQHRDLPNPVALDTPFTEPSIEPNAQHEVSVTWIISPGSFYTQILSLQPKFLEMMHRIPDIYKGVKPFAGSIPVGASVLARYPEDKVLYRATVVTSQPFGKYIVQYIDFGNKFVVDARDIWQLDQELMELPKMAVHCSLLGVAPTEGEWKANSEIDLCFNGPRYQCVFQDCVEGRHNVSLWNNSVSVADTLVEKQLAVGADSAAVTLKDDPIDLTIVVGQEMPCRVTHVQSFEEFYIQLDFRKADLVESVIANYDASLLEPLNKESLADGVHCTVKYEGKVYRTILTDTSDSAAIKAVLPDYGNPITTTLDNLMILPTDLSVYYYQSLQCCFNNYSAESTQLMTLDELKQLLGKHFIVFVNDVAGSTLVTTLYEPATGTKLALFTPDEDAYPSVIPLSSHSVLHRGLGGCHVTHAAALAELWLQRADDAERLAVLLDELYKHYEEGAPEPLESFEAEGLCAAKSSDGNWYRATILSSTDADCTVQFTDYGNSETVAKETVKKLDSKFYEPCALAVQVSLGLVALADDALTKLQEWIGENEVQVTLSYGADGWLANLHLDGVDLSIKLVNEKLATPQVDGQETEPAETQAAEVKAPEGCTQVYISHIDTPGLFWLQMSDKIDAIEEIQEQLQANAASYEDVESRELGTVCVAKYLADELWYRAEILDADADITTVRFIDYGNTDVLDNQPGLLKLIPEALKEVERYAVKASVNAVPTGTGQWSEPASECFTRLVGDLSVPVDALIVLKDHHHDTTYLDVFVDGQNITDKLVADGHATRSDETECGGDLPSCFASHVNSPSEFWIQLETATPELQAMEAAMVDAETFPELTDKEEGVICAAKYPEDDSWYRAQVIVDGSEGTEVLFMDYGNASIATELRNLPEELKTKPALSRKCALQKPRDLSWSRKSESKFNELAAEGATVFNVQFIASGDISIVELFYEGKSVTEELVGMCEQAPSTEAAPQETEATVTETVTEETEAPVTQAVTEEAAALIPERPTPLGQEQCNGKICYANSIEEFYVQLDTARADLAKVMERLIDGPDFEVLSELQVGTSCAAFWAEDEQWYRAKVLELSDGGNQVLFTDYGNKAKCTDFRQLPEDLAAIKPIAKSCRLTTGATSSNEKMKKRFDDLIAADWTFQIEFVENTKEPFLVKLLLNGENIFTSITTEGTPEPETTADKRETEETISAPAIGTAQTEAEETISAPANETAQTGADKQETEETVSAPAIETAQTKVEETISAPANGTAQTGADKQENEETVSAPAIETAQTEAEETISAPANVTAQTGADKQETEETVNASAIETAQTEVEETISDPANVTAQTGADKQETEETVNASAIETAQTEAEETISDPANVTAQTGADKQETEETVNASAIETAQTEAEEIISAPANVTAQAGADKQETVNASAIETAQTEAEETISAPAIETAQTEAEETASVPAIKTAQTEADVLETEETISAPAIQNVPHEVVTKPEENEVVKAEDEKVDAPETPTKATDAKTTELDSSLNESIESNHTVIENKSFEADAETLDKEISENTDDGFKSEAPLSPENNSSVDTLESSNETIKTPEKETTETIKTPERDTDTGYTSGGDHDKSLVTEPLDKENPEKPKSEEKTVEPIIPAALMDTKPLDPAKLNKSF